MYKVIHIGEGIIDRFITVLDENGVEIEVFDDSGVTTAEPSEIFQYVIGEEYKMRFVLFGDLVDVYESVKYGNALKFKIIGKEQIGKQMLYKIESELGEFLIEINVKTEQVEKKKIKTGIFNYSRIDLVQVDDRIHPEYK